MIDLDAFSQAVAEIYDSALSTERWDTALVTLSRLFASSKAQLSYFHSWSDHHPFFRFVGFDPALMDRMMDKYLSLTATDPRRTSQSFKPYHCRQVVSENILRSSEMYRQVLAPMGIEYSMFVVFDLSIDERCIVSLMRGPESAPFTALDCEEFGRFVPHIGRAIGIRGTLSRARDIAAASQALINGVPVAMAVLQDDWIVMTNAAASVLLAQGDAVRRNNNSLQAATPQAQGQLMRAISEARAANGDPVGVTLPAGETGQLRIVIRALDAETATILGGRLGSVALYMTDTRHPIETGEEVVRRLFGLTEREAAVVCALVRGEDTHEIALRLDIGRETVKTHLKHIMQSVGVRRQAELVRTVVSSPAWIGAQRGAVTTPDGGQVSPAAPAPTSRAGRARTRAAL